MNKTIIVLAMLVMLASMVSAETCFTVMNSPTSTKHYWSAITYDRIKDNELQGINFLDRSNNLYNNPGLGIGYQYNIRVDNKCFDNYLISRYDATGANSGQLSIQKNNDDLYAATLNTNSLYTVSRKDITSQSTSLVGSVGNGVINNVDYLHMPDSFNGINHPEYLVMKEGLCNDNLKITDQLYKITDKVWKNLDFAESVDCGTGYDNIVDCILDKGKGNSAHYSVLVTLLARDCGIPTRIVYGISEGSFDGIDIKLSADKKHFWIQYYDGIWYPMDITEDATTGPSKIEVNCIDSKDNDGDGYPDCSDQDCKAVTFCQGEYPTTFDFDNSYSTDISKLPNVYNIQDLLLGNIYGSVRWINQSIDLRNKDLDSALDISFSSIQLNSNIPGLIKPSIMTMKDLDYSEPVVLLNGNKCSSCKIISYEQGNLIFSAPGVGNYRVKENDTLSAAELENSQDVTSSSSNLSNSTNTSYLPALPESTTSSAGFLSKPKTWISNLWTKFKAYSTVKKIIIVAVIGTIVWFLFFRRRY